MFDPFYAWRNHTEEPLSKIRRARQISESHCGPATIEMLLSHLDISVTQEEISQAIQADEFIQDRGTRIDELAKALSIVAPDVQMWSKEYTTREELHALVHLYRFPVGVEWQNLFYDTIQEELEDTNWHPENHDFGHYSVVKGVDLESDEITMIDPYFEFDEEFRFFSLAWFESRWWDYNTVRNSRTGRITRKKDDRLCFILTIKGTPFPKVFSMKPVSFA